MLTLRTETPESESKTVVSIFESIDVGEISLSERQRLLKILEILRKSFANNFESFFSLGCTDFIEKTIETTYDKPVYFKPYRLSHKGR